MANDPELLEPEGGLPDALRDPLGTVRRRWRWMLATLGLGVAATIGIVLTLTPRFAATASLVVTTKQIREEFVRATLEDDLIERLDAVMATVLSRQTLVSLVEKHDPYPELRSELSVPEIAARVLKDVTVIPQKRLQPTRRGATSLLFWLTVEASRPDAAAGLANDLAERLVNESIGSRTRQAEQALAFLQSERERAQQALREQTGEIRAFKERYRGELPGDLPANLTRLERLQQQRQSLAIQIAEARTQLAMLAAPSETPIVETPDTAEERLAALRMTLQELRSTYTEKHPEVVYVVRQIQELEDELGIDAPDDASEPLPTRSALISAAQNTLLLLQQQLRQSEAEIADIDERVARTPARQEELDGMVAREAVLEENYRTLIRKVQEAELAQNLESAQQGDRFSVVDPAIAPSHPTRTPIRYLAAGLMVSFGLAVVVGFILEMLDPVLVRASQVEAESGLPILGSAPHIS